MQDILQLSKKLFESDYFLTELKYKIEQFSNFKKHPSDQQIFIKPLPQNPTLQLNEKFMQLTEQPRFCQQRPSITSSAFQKRESIDSLSSMNSNPIFQQYLQTYSMNQGHKINELTSQISNILTEMIKKEFQVLNGLKVIGPSAFLPQQNVAQLIQKMKQLQKQQMQNVKQELQEKIQSLKSQIQQQVITIIQRLKIQKRGKKIHDKSSLIKKQRKKVTQSIIDMSKSNQQMSTFSNIQDVDNILSDSEQEEVETSIVKRNFPQISQMNSRILQIEKSQVKFGKQFEERFLKQVEQNKKDIQQLTQKIIEWKLKNEEKLQNGFSGVWNIVTDIQDKINRVNLRVVQIIHSLS